MACLACKCSLRRPLFPTGTHLDSSWAVLRTDAAVPLSPAGCTDTAALTFDARAILHVSAACVYAAPPPPLGSTGLILLSAWPLVAGWLGLWTIFAMILECVTARRLERPQFDVRLGTRVLQPSSLWRRLVLKTTLRLWYFHCLLWLLHPCDYTRRTRLSLSLPQALLLAVAPLLLAWTLLTLVLGIASELREAAGDVSDVTGSDHWLGELAGGGVLGGALNRVTLWHVALLVAALIALFRELLRTAILRANHQVHL